MMNFFLKNQKMLINEDFTEYYLQKLHIKSPQVKLQRKLFKFTSLDTKNGINKIFKVLNYEFKTTSLGCLGITSKNIQKLSELIYQSNTTGIIKSDYHLAITDFSLLSSKSISVNNWHKLGYICNANGLFNLSGICRQKAADFVLERYQKNKKISSLIAMFKLCLDQGDYKQATEIINHVNAKSNSPYVRYLYKHFKSYQEKTNIDIDELNSTQTAFYKLINDKSIAIVTPGLVDITEDIIKEINSFDLVILLNYKGTKIDDRINISIVSYYNSEYAKKLGDTFDQFKDELTFSVFKKVSNDNQNNLVQKNCAKKVDSDLNEFFFAHQPNMLQIVLDDLLTYSPQRIKAYGSNFYLTQNIYSSNYIGKKPNKSDMWRAFAIHNLLSQVNYVRALDSIKAIELDQPCLDVINMKENDLLNAYEAIYSNIK